MDRIVLASNQPHVIREFRQFIERRFPSFLFATNEDLGTTEPPETGPSYAAMASDKAYPAAEFAHAYAVGVCEGLEVDCMDGGPGLESQSFGGAGASMNEKARLIREAVAAVPEMARTARLRCTLILMPPPQDFADRDFQPAVFEATCEGLIPTYSPVEENSGYDSLLWIPGKACRASRWAPGSRACA